MMTLERLQTLARAFLDGAAENRVPPDKALAPELAGMRMYETALLGAARADDALLLSLCRPSTAGLIMDAPTKWLEGAQTVVSFFLPFTQSVRESNRARDDRPSKPWMHARIEGQACMLALSHHLAKALESQGYRVAVPADDPRFWSDLGKSPEQRGRNTYQSNWSERHVAHVCGLGTFSRSKGLITALGVAGRFGSLITDAALEPTPRSYDHREAYCLRCGACARNCPVQAITMEEGKDEIRCSALNGQIRRENEPYYGCGKCQVDVPCEACIPGR